MKQIDQFLDYITMYRLLLYYLLVIIVVALGLAFWGILPFGPLALLLSVSVLVVVSWLINQFLAWIFKAQTNFESVFISALIASLLITPMINFSNLIFLIVVGVLISASKFILAIKRKHLFNPVAIALVISTLILGKSASWWVGTMSLLPLSLLGVLIVRKIRRFDLVLSFLVSAFLVTFIFALTKGTNLINLLSQLLADSPIIFFAFVMLTEPLTTPPNRRLRVMYGALVGLLFAPEIHLGGIYSTPELALVLGNIFSFLVSPREKLILKLKNKIKLTSDIYDFIFDGKIDFKSGQYLEWTLSHNKVDSRGNRRYFTIASSPTEKEIRIGVKFENNSSSFKRKLLEMDKGTEIVAGQLSGDFTLPDDKNKKLLFIAGGIGITPFRSMLKFLVDKDERRDIYLLYIIEKKIYRDVLRESEKLGVKVITWDKSKGIIDMNILKAQVPDISDRLVFISGSRNFVNSFKSITKKLGAKVKTDLFPGYA